MSSVIISNENQIVYPDISWDYVSKNIFTQFQSSSLKIIYVIKAI